MLRRHRRPDTLTESQLLPDPAGAVPSDEGGFDKC